jgi:hypothetical protein
MLVNDLLANNAWRSTHKGFRFTNSKTVVWSNVERTSKGKIRVSRAVQGSWNTRLMQRYTKPDQMVVLVPLTV